MDGTEFDRQMMRRCLELAQQAIGRTAPNPMVGAVVVRNGKIVGEGFHPQAGQPHAEVFALQAASAQAQGATLYVNLEPCNHFGRTPPCTEAVIQAGIERVMVGMVDPDPRVAGGGIDRLRAAGINVVVGIEAASCQQLNEAFVHRVTQQRPFGIFKYAMTLDGKIATTTGHSAWITSPIARQRVHQLRATCDAIIVGGNTVRRDNPHLTTHGVSDRNPLRVVMSRSLDLPISANLWQTAIAPTVVFTAPNGNPLVKQQLLDQRVMVVELDNPSPTQVMKTLGDRGVSTVLWECGGQLAAQAIGEGCVQKVLAFIAPKLVGGNAPSPVGEMGITQMTEALVLDRLKIEAIGADYLLEGYLLP
ncbi:MAG: bifunctional diaminohydroxyphosphoribosylaminopyrimidine deaminase/5-amino-6-(5-phosphoribosylamino)uracil reductase RibD [Leptolyngbyaceae cyanobacterium SL_7_1]|nr:bifunctional diaminohydroxyphosphoribosylaminopyrimidine deaminase/5-amino-6-(5-phosphoribosylamino)uracil reductase RibD [Leptolyngbyaceae cyanobacterium SL_7_1]